MSQTVFMSFEPADAARAAGIAALLRRRGVPVAGDLTIPAGTSREAVLGEALGQAQVVLALWSRASASAGVESFVAAEADSGAARNAYLGALLDRVTPPARFAGRPLVDLVGWSGGDDKPMEALIETVIARLPGKPVPPSEPGAEERAVRRRSQRSRVVLAVVAAMVAIIAGAILVPILTRRPPTPQDQLRSTLAAIPCSWLQVDPVDNGTTGKLVLTGVADRPEAAGEQVRQLLAKAEKPPLVTTDRIARIASADCPAIDEPRTLRQDDGGRLRVTSDGVGRDAAMRLAEARVHLSFKPEDKAMALFGIEPSGKVTWVLPDFATLEALAGEDVGFAKQGRDYDFSLRSDHLGWTGLLLVTGSAPLSDEQPQGTVRDSRAFADFLKRGSAGGDQKAEMVWYEITPR